MCKECPYCKKKGTMIPVRDSKDKRNINMYNSE